MQPLEICEALVHGQRLDGIHETLLAASERSLEFVGTALNFLNHANWNEPDARIGTEDSPNTNAGRIIGSRGGRVIQLGLRFTF